MKCCLLHPLLIIKLLYWDCSDCTVGKALVSHEAKSGWILGTLCGSLSPPGIIFEWKARNNQWSLIWSGWAKMKANKHFPCNKQLIIFINLIDLMRCNAKYQIVSFLLRLLKIILMCWKCFFCGTFWEMILFLIMMQFRIYIWVIHFYLFFYLEALTQLYSELITGSVFRITPDRAKWLYWDEAWVGYMGGKSFIF